MVEEIREPKEDIAELRERLQAAEDEEAREKVAASETPDKNLVERLEAGEFQRTYDGALQVIEEIMQERADKAGIDIEDAVEPTVSEVVDAFANKAIVDYPELKDVFKRGVILGIVLTNKGVKDNARRQEEGRRRRAIRRPN